MNTRTCKLYCIILLFPNLLLAAELSANSQELQSIKLTKTRSPGAELQLQTRKASLPQIFNEISKTTGTVVHYSVVPQEPVTATCAGSNVTEILTCLLGHQINLVYVDAQNTAPDQQQHSARQPAEIWLLGSSLNTCTAGAASIASSLSPDRPDTDSAQAIEATAEEQQLQTLERVREARIRAQALVSLSNSREVDDDTVAKILQDALSDDDPGVRSKALSGLVRREGPAASDVLQHALLNDSDARVRITALSYIKDDSALFEQALNDSDEQVRILAKMKLEILLAE